MINLPSFKQLQYLVAVVEERHFGRAAERCFVTQSTLSSGIQELESLLGCQLLERSKRRVLPTAIGLEVCEQARRLLNSGREMVESAKRGGDPLSGPLRLGLIPTIGPFLLPRVLPGVRRQAPGLELQLREDQSDHLLKQLTEGDIDCALLAFPYPVGRLRQRVFWQEDFLLAIPAGHPLSDQDAVDVGAIPADQLLLLEQGHCLTDHAMSACNLQGVRASSAFQGSSLYTLLQMVAGGEGMTFVPEMAADSLKGLAGEVDLRRLQQPGPHRRIGLVWRPTADSGRFDLLCDALALQLQGDELQR